MMINKDVPFTAYRYENGHRIKVYPEKTSPKKQNAAYEKSKNNPPNYKSQAHTSIQGYNGLSAKTRALILTGALFLGIGTLAHLTNIRKNYVPKQEKSEKNVKSEKSENTIASAEFKGQTYYFSPKDSLLRNICSQTTYFNLKKNTYNSDSVNIAYDFASQLSLEQLLEAGDLKGLPRTYAGYLSGKSHFEEALSLLWLKKTKQMKGRFRDLKNSFIEQYRQETTEKSNIKTFRDMIGEQLDTLTANFEYGSFYLKHNNHSNPKKTIGHPEKERFFRNHLMPSRNTLLAYTVTELFPSNTNPSVNIALYDKMLEYAGMEFVNKIPAMSDPYLSFGPFQLTSIAINPQGAPRLNAFLPERLHVPESMKNYSTTENHIRGAALVTIYNSEILANKLMRENLLEKFNAGFEKLDTLKQEEFFAGYLAAAHYKPTCAASAVCTFMKEVERGYMDFEDITTGLRFNGIQKRYYEQSLKNYMAISELQKRWDK